MGKIILCNARQAIIPYVFTNTKVEVFSYEELCFYIYNNVALLNPEQFQGKMIQWLKTELGMEELAEKLMEQLASEGSFIDMLVAILSAGSYYETAEIRQFMDKQELVGLLPAEEKLKLKADSFLMYKRLLKAMSLYDEILRQEERIEDKKFLGDVYHNKGVALAKNMELTKAKLCFLEAFNRNQKKASLEAYISLRLLEDSQEVVAQEARTLGMEEADYARQVMLVEDSVDDSMNTAVYNRYQKALYNQEHGDQEAFNQRVDMLLNQWKEEFREQVI
ncbi:MAG: hypothetical protein IJ040_03530 [Lachnospiraceae bacterium]|nr:hypothetical protein [Lachnospiraceae bacterium]